MHLGPLAGFHLKNKAFLSEGFQTSDGITSTTISVPFAFPFKITTDAFSAERMSLGNAPK